MNPIYIGGIAITADMGYRSAVLAMLAMIAYNTSRLEYYFWG